MITFLTLFLGLTLGPQVVDLQVDPGVAAVELRLDGELVDRLEGPPWRGRLDLGWELAPRRLEAVALDAEGNELDRAQQGLNLPRAPAEVTLFFDDRSSPGDPAGSPAGRTGSRRVRLTWQSVLGSQPTAVRMELDGAPLVGATLAGAELPALDPETVHFLRVELDFPDNLSASDELVFGGGVQEEISTRLTAVPVIVEGRTPEPRQFEGWLEVVDGEAKPLRVRAVEAGGVDLVVVPGEGAQGILERLILDWRSQSSLRLGMRTDPQAVEDEVRRSYKLLPEQQVRMLWPHPTTYRGNRRQTYDLFLSSPPYTDQDGGLLWLMSRVRPNVELSATTQLAEAVAVAGTQAAARDRRRAVVLLRAGGGRDASQLAPLTVRRYLERLRVPLYVLALEEGLPDDGWGEALDASTLARLDRVLRRLRRELEDQRILWVDGRHLPQSVRLTPQARRMTLAGMPVPASAGPSPPPRGDWMARPEPPVDELQTPSAERSATEALKHLDLPNTAGPSLFDVGPSASGTSDRTLFIGSGTALRAAPAEDAPRLTVVDAGVDVPVVEEREVAGRPWWRVTWNGRSGWVPVDAEGRLASKSVPVPVAPSSGAPSSEEMPTGFEARLKRAERWLRPRGRLGPWPLWTDLDDEELLSRLDHLAGELPAAWLERIGLDPSRVAEASGSSGEAVLLFAREEDYQAFAQEEDSAVVELGLAGHAGGGLAVLAVGERNWQSLAALMVHELVHLLSDRIFPGGLPPWLQEGLADELAYSRVEADGRLVPGTLGGDTTVRVWSSRLTPGQVRVERQEELSGALASLGRLQQAVAAGAAPDLAPLLDLSWDQFVRPEDRGLRYATSAFLVRFLVERHGEALRGFLQSAAAGGSTDRERLGQYLAVSGAVKLSAIGGLQRAFESWLRAEAARAGVL